MPEEPELDDPDREAGSAFGLSAPLGADVEVAVPLPRTGVTIGARAIVFRDAPPEVPAREAGFDVADEAGGAAACDDEAGPGFDDDDAAAAGGFDVGIGAGNGPDFAAAFGAVEGAPALVAVEGAPAFVEDAAGFAGAAGFVAGAAGFVAGAAGFVAGAVGFVAGAVGFAEPPGASVGARGTVLTPAAVPARGNVRVVVVRGAGTPAAGVPDDCRTRSASLSSEATGVCWSCSHSATSIASSSTTDASSSGDFFVISKSPR